MTLLWHTRHLVGLVSISDADDDDALFLRNG